MVKPKTLFLLFSFERAIALIEAQLFSWAFFLFKF